MVNSKSQGNNAGGSSNGKRPSVSGVGGMASILRRGSRSIGKHVAGAVGTYLPTAVTEMWEPQRDFAFVKLPNGTGGRSSGTSGNGRSNGVVVLVLDLQVVLAALVVSSLLLHSMLNPPGYLLLPVRDTFISMKLTWVREVKEPCCNNTVCLIIVTSKAGGI